MLLVGASLLVRSFLRVTALDLGFRADRVLTAMINLTPARYGDPARQVAFIDELVRRVQTLPGVQAAGVSQTLPLTGINDQGGFRVEGRPDPAPGTQRAPREPSSCVARLLCGHGHPVARTAGCSTPGTGPTRCRSRSSAMSPPGSIGRA